MATIWLTDLTTVVLPIIPSYSSLPITLVMPQFCLATQGTHFLNTFPVHPPNVDNNDLLHVQNWFTQH